MTAFKRIVFAERGPEQADVLAAHRDVFHRVAEGVGMDERALLSLIAGELPSAGDDAAVVDDLVVTTDMLHATTDFPAGTTGYTEGWRAVGASLSDVAAMGAKAVAAVAAYGAPTFEPEAVQSFIQGARDVCELAGGEYVGGDVDIHDEFTVATTAVGRTDAPVYRHGVSVGEAVCVTGALGRTAAALSLFERGEVERGNELFRFEPRVAAGRAIAPHATAMMDSSDGLARSLHQLGEASDCGFAVRSERLPIHEAVWEIAPGEREAVDLATTVGEDFELVCTLPEGTVPDARAASPAPIARIGSVTDAGIELDGTPLGDEGYVHGEF
jgi:thiamine-monophosphate kinase